MTKLVVELLINIMAGFSNPLANQRRSKIGQFWWPEFESGMSKTGHNYVDPKPLEFLIRQGVRGNKPAIILINSGIQIFRKKKFTLSCWRNAHRRHPQKWPILMTRFCVIWAATALRRGISLRITLAFLGVFHKSELARKLKFGFLLQFKRELGSIGRETGGYRKIRWVALGFDPPVARWAH